MKWSKPVTVLVLSLWLNNHAVVPESPLNGLAEKGTGVVTIILDPFAGAVVRNAVNDMQKLLKRSRFAGDSVTVRIGVQSSPIIRMVLQASGLALSGKLAEQEAWISSRRCFERQEIFISGGGDLGVQYAVFEFMDRIRFSGNSFTIPEDLQYRSCPYFRLRGMYAHLHWQYASPYALRSWNDEEWKRYIDLLARLRFNLLQIWSFVGSLPNPLSKGDRKFLERFQRIVAYAKEQRGFEVWIGEAANNVANGDGGVPIEKREYFQVEALKDPGDKVQFAAILENRENLYRFVNNVDGYWIIDSDPGRYEGSVDSEFVNLFAANRNLIDRYCPEKSKTKMLYWMWDGWDKSLRQAWLNNPKSWENVVTGLQSRLAEPWWILVSARNQIPLIDGMHLWHKSVYFPYNTLENEPSTPHTTLRFNRIDSAIAWIRSFAKIQGAMGNAQTPYVQLPNIAYWGETVWSGPDAAVDPFSSLIRLGNILQPGRSDLLARAWQLLEADDDEAIKKIQSDMEAAFGPCSDQPDTFPVRIAQDLLMQLTLRLFGIQAARANVEGRSLERNSLLTQYARTSLMWQRRTNYFGTLRPGSGRQVRYPICGPRFALLRASLADVPSIDLTSWRRLAETTLRMEHFNPEAIQYVLDEIDGSRVPERSHAY